MLTNVELPIEQIASLVASQLSINSDPNLVYKKELEAEVLLILQSKFDLIQKQINLLNKTKNVSEVNNLHIDGDIIELILSNGNNFSIDMSLVTNKLPFITSTDMSNRNSVINKSNKYRGKQVINTNSNKVFYATGSLDNSEWRSVDGVDAVIPN